MEKFLTIFIIAVFIIAPCLVDADLKTMSDEQMGITTGQAGFSQSLKFDEIFANRGGNLPSDKNQISFEEVFAKLAQANTNPQSLNFEQAFSQNTTSINGSTITQDINLAGVQMKNVTFDQAFSKVTGVDLGIGKAMGVDMKMDVNINSGSIRVQYNK